MDHVFLVWFDVNTLNVLLDSGRIGRREETLRVAHSRHSSSTRSVQQRPGGGRPFPPLAWRAHITSEVSITTIVQRLCCPDCSMIAEVC